ncbi:hypothetical protein L6164_010406 [Bauhinia variegata]|uniref:Uncharacterized protein n=1 Tax=Bauhinia variegata TaxID=167791 RepID=A0ACB9PLY2_BAUVA|nr:hypothetical protein L6164_010406 [Bauhinia variegata]
MKSLNFQTVYCSTEPIKSGITDPKLGIGKQEDDFFTAEENIQREKLDVELEETEEHVKKREKVAYSMYASLLKELVCHKEPSSLEGLENFLLFLLPGGFFCLLLPHYENPGLSRTTDARKQQQEDSAPASVSSESGTATALAGQDQRKALKFGFSSQGSGSKSVRDLAEFKIYSVVLQRSQKLQHPLYSATTLMKNRGK